MFNLIGLGWQGVYHRRTWYIAPGSPVRNRCLVSTIEYFAAEIICTLPPYRRRWVLFKQTTSIIGLSLIPKTSGRSLYRKVHVFGMWITSTVADALQMAMKERG